MRRVLIALLASWIAASAAAAESVDLTGTWYVLVHYKDSSAGNADQERWDDRVWVFANEGRKLRWTEYPIVVFGDETGRFERRETGQYARILHFWEPNEQQLANIRDGLKVNTRGSKTKTLRGSDAQGWTSEQRSTAGSASVVTYTEVWAIEGLPAQPVFTRRDMMGGGRTSSLEGLARYATTEVRDGGSVLVGTFERDESRRGTFTMMRSGPVGSLEQKSQEEIQRQAALRGLQSSSEARAAATRAVETQLGAVGLAVSEAEFSELTDKALALFAQGVSQEDIGAKLAEDIRAKLRSVAEPGAHPDDAVRYRWPFDSAQPRALLRAEDGVFDFDLPEDTPVVAAREGVVTRVVDGHGEGAAGPSSALRANTVYVRHPDGTFAVYAHLKAGIRVKPGQSIAAGAPLGASGASGAARFGLSFAVLRLDAEGRSQPVAIRFAGGANGVVPVAGSSYGGR
jgi:murein DD-endopeptidase MepM/ murein hydrolase activator NlpD